jgi:CHAT domain-containing protein
LSPENIVTILLHDLDNPRISEKSSSELKKKHAYLLGYIGKIFETKLFSLEDSNLALESLKSKLKMLFPDVYTDCKNDDLCFGKMSTIQALKIIDDLQGSTNSLSSTDFWNVSYQSSQWLSQLGRIYNLKKERESAIAAYSAAIQTIETIRKSMLSTDTEDIEDQFSFRDQVQPIYREYVSLLLAKGEQKQGNLKTARNVIEDLQLGELENFLGCDLPERKIADELANRDESAVIVYPIILSDRLEVIFSFAPKPGEKERELKHYSSEISKEKLELKLRELRYRLEQPYTTKKAQQISKEVYSWLIEGAERDGSLTPSDKDNPAKHTLLFVADGALRNIPMAALEDSEGHYLIEKYAVAIAPRLQLLVDDRQRSKDPRIILAGLTGKPKDANFGTLKYVKDEINAIEGVFKKGSTRLIDRNFTRETLRANLAKGADIVHLATHGEFNYSKKDTFILTEEGKASLQELENLFQNNRHLIDLLVLSACETATGDDRDTLGIAGMTVRSGAHSSIASLWSIEGYYTSKFMNTLYKELLNQENKNKADALRKAMIDTLKIQPDGFPPSKWSSYLLVGDWR